jgi:hypothetical protein
MIMRPGISVTDAQGEGLRMRAFIRPEISDELLRELVPRTRRVFVNAGWERLATALCGLQARCQRRTLSLPALRELYDASQEEGFFCRCIGTAYECPPSYRYDFSTTQAAAFRLGNGPTVFIMERTTTAPGEAVQPLLPPLASERRGVVVFLWLESALVLAWPFLTDAEIAEMEGWAAAVSLARFTEQEDEDRETECLDETAGAARPDAAAARKLAGYRMTLLKALLPACQGRLPVFTGELQERLAMVAATLGAEARESIAWSTFKKRWPSLAERYQDQLIQGLDRDNRLRVQAMTALARPAGFTLALGRWTGPQRQFDVPQLVLQVNARPLFDAIVARTPEHRSLVEAWTRHNKGLASAHPLAAWTVGWLRVHVSDGWVFIDEIQSDPLECFGGKENMAPLVEAVRKRWHLHGAATIHRWAREIECRFTMHSRESLLAKPEATKSLRKWQTYYEPVAKAFGLTPVSHPDFKVPILGERPTLRDRGGGNGVDEGRPT